MLHPFASSRHFLDLIITDFNVRSKILENITKEKYYISRFLNTSYVDLDEITRIERNMLLKFIKEDKEAEQNQIKKLRNRV